MEQEFDAIVIGAGAAGLLGALEIASTGRSVAVIEAKERAGGRIHTTYYEDFPVELGAEFVHGKLPITQDILRRSGSQTYEVSGSIWQKKEGRLSEQEDFIEDFAVLEKKFKEVKQDLSVAAFINTHLQDDRYAELRFTLRNYVEGYYAADISKASTLSLCEELTQADDEQFRMESGYQPLVHYLEQQCRGKGVQFFFSQPVWQLHWKAGEAAAITEKGTFRGRKALITVPVGVLQQEGITFSPTLKEKTAAARELGFGHVVKVNLLFEKPFWQKKEAAEGKDLTDMNFLFSQETIPTWWSQHPKNECMLTGWLGGPKAEALLTLDKEDIVKKAIHSLSQIFSIDVIHIDQQLQQSWFYNWTADPFAQGAYSYAVLNGERLMQEILQPVEQTLYFAGEGLHHGNEIGTVEGALNSGRTVAHQLIAQY